MNTNNHVTKEGQGTTRTPNKLIDEKSPYLLQHAYNPVKWYPWGTEAFELAKRENKPIFLSIGYSSCHWCHVMEKESFEDLEVASLLNNSYISIKVDREERPDVDHIYMNVCQSLTGSGGWPLTIIMTPDKKPFFTGTYFPKDDRMGYGLLSILSSINNAWHNNHEKLQETSNKIFDTIKQSEEFFNIQSLEDEGIHENITKRPMAEIFPPTLLHETFSLFQSDYDVIYGGFGGAPKFPTPHNLYFLLRYWHQTKEKSALAMVEKTLEAMYKGGIFDHIGFGFCRYSTDRKWLIPHFEKMLYDNALVSIAYLETYQITKNQRYAEIASHVFSYVLRDMTSKEGGFYSAEDADSEGEEGKFYTWKKEEIMKVLGDADGEKYCALYDITDSGNFEGQNIPNLIKQNLKEIDNNFINHCQEKLFHYRENRIHPNKDDKILTSWNGLMIAAMAIGGRILGNDEYIYAAENAVQFISKYLIRKEDGRLLARYRDGEAAFPAYVDDYSFFIWGLIELYQTTYKYEYLEMAIKLNDDFITYFWDEKNGGFYVYGSDSEQLIIRPKDIYDGATPSGNSVSALNLLRLARLTGQFDLEDKAHQLLRVFSETITNYPKAYSYSMIALSFMMSKSSEIVIVTDKCTDEEAQKMIDVIYEDFHPFTISLLYSKENKGLEKIAPFVADYSTINGKSAAYLCENFACQAPVTSSVALKQMICNSKETMI